MSAESKTGMKILYKHPFLTIVEYDNEIYLRTYDFIAEYINWSRIDEERGLIFYKFNGKSQTEVHKILEPLFLELENEN